MENGFSVAQILKWTGGVLANEDALSIPSDSIRVLRPAPLVASGAEDCCFFFAKSYQNEIPAAAPGVLITGEVFIAPLQASGLPIWRTSAIVACKDPYLAMAVLSERFAEKISSVAHVRVDPELIGAAPEIHPSAVVHPTAQLANGVRIGPNCVVEEDAQIGVGSVLYAGTYVGKESKIGEGCVLFPGVTLYERVTLGKRVRIHAGSTLGSDGFGYAPMIEGGVPVGHRKIYHLGTVIVGDDVEIGANSMVDRATIGETWIGAMAKIDNHVHIGHNSRVGEGAILCGGVCLAGGTVIGRFAYLGGMSGIGNKAKVGDYAKIGAMSIIDKDVPAGGASVGNPQRTHRDHFKVHALLNRLLAERDSRKKG